MTGPDLNRRATPEARGWGRGTRVAMALGSPVLGVARVIDWLAERGASLVLGVPAPPRCGRDGHTWFPDLERSEFIPVSDVCLRCQAERHQLPWGTCLRGDHPLASHYRADLSVKPVGDCPGPQ